MTAFQTGARHCFPLPTSAWVPAREQEDLCVCDYWVTSRREQDQGSHLSFSEHYSDGEESTCSAGDSGLIPGSGRSPGEGNGNPLQYSCLKTFMDRGAWQATVHGVAKGQT